MIYCICLFDVRNDIVSRLTMKSGAGIPDFFHVLLDADPDRAVLWHCTSGKDRTGLAAMLLLSALEVPEDVIIADYLLTNDCYAARIEVTKQLLRSKGCGDEYIKKRCLCWTLSMNVSCAARSRISIKDMVLLPVISVMD